MTTQALLARSPDGRYFAAQAHHLIGLVDASTGAQIDLPAPNFTALTAGEGDGDSDEDEDADGGADGGDGGDDAAQQPKKKQKQDKSGAAKGQRSHEGPKPIRVLEFHQNNEWFMYQSEDKYIHLYHIHASYTPSGFKHIVTVTVPKKVQVATFQPGFSPSTSQFHPSSSSTPLQLPHIFVADKTGEIFLICGPDLATQRLELGHLANVTGLAYHVQGSKRFLLSSDSDGKIRVSNSPNYFDIQAFCLGHQAFVSSFTVLPTQPPKIVSGGLGSELILWNLMDGKEIARVDVAAHRGSAAASSSSSPVVAAAQPGKNDCYISQVTALDAENILVSVYPWPSVFFFHIGTANSVTLKSTVTLPTTPMYTYEDEKDQILIVDETLHVRALGRNGEEVKDELVSKTLASLNKPLAEAQAVVNEFAITQQNADSFVGGGTDAPPKFVQQTEEGKARAAASVAAGNPGRYISPFSSTHADHVMRLSLLSPAGFTYRRYADKMQREAYIQGKKQEAAAKREAAKAEKQKKREENQRQRRDENDMDDQ